VGSSKTCVASDSRGPVLIVARYARSIMSDVASRRSYLIFFFSLSLSLSLSLSTLACVHDVFSLWHSLEIYIFYPSALRRVTVECILGGSAPPNFVVTGVVCQSQCVRGQYIANPTLVERRSRAFTIRLHIPRREDGSAKRLARSAVLSLRKITLITILTNRILGKL